MSKHEFMTRLYNALAGLSEQERNDILNDYEEHFRIGLEMGKSEAEIADALGSPEELAASFADDRERAPAADAPESEETGDERYAEAGPFEQEAPQYRDYYNPDEYADGYSVPPAYDAAQEPGYGAYPPPGYQQPGPAQRSSGGTAVLLGLLILLTIFVVPVMLGLIVSFFAVILCLAFAAGWFGVAVLVTYGASAGWLLAGIGLLCLCACLLLCLITYTSGCCKLIAKYFRFFARTASGRRKESV